MPPLGIAALLLAMPIPAITQTSSATVKAANGSTQTTNTLYQDVLAGVTKFAKNITTGIIQRQKGKDFDTSLLTLMYKQKGDALYNHTVTYFEEHPDAQCTAADIIAMVPFQGYSSFTKTLQLVLPHCNQIPRGVYKNDAVEQVYLLDVLYGAGLEKDTGMLSVRENGAFDILMKYKFYSPGLQKAVDIFVGDYKEILAENKTLADDDKKLFKLYIRLATILEANRKNLGASKPQNDGTINIKIDNFRL